MKVLLLGATGLLGRNVLERLLDDGRRVTAVVRREVNDLPTSDLLDIKVVSDMGRQSLVKAAAGCEAIINCAGCTDMGLLHLDDYMPANRDLCQTLLQVMMQCPVRTLIHVSTANTVGGGTADNPGTEDREAAEPFASSLYVQSKQAGEQLLLKAANGLEDRRIIVVNPGFMIGAHDLKPSSGRMVDAGWRLPLMAAPGGGKSFVAVGDVAAAIVNALTMGRSGERYLLTGDNLTFRQFYALCAEAGGYRQLFVTLPDWLIRTAGRLGDLLRGMGLRTSLSSVNVGLLMAREYFSNAKARAELQMPQTPLVEAIKQYKGIQ